MSEADVLARVRLAASNAGYAMWRNNVGMGWAGKPSILEDGSVLLRNPRPLHAGLCEGSSDLIGLRRITITPDMVGRQVAVFTAIEVKTPTGRVSKEQQRFLDFVNQAGGVGLVVRSEEDLR